jgi:hypothetical protein
METWVMGVGLRPTGKPVDEPPDPKAVRAVFLSRLREALGNRRSYREMPLIKEDDHNEKNQEK